VTTRIRIRRIDKLDGFTPTGISLDDLTILQQNQDIQNLRNEAHADVVSIVLRNQSSGGLVSFCGRAFVQRPGCGASAPVPGCDVGEQFNDFAYHWVALNCLRSRFSLLHELAHNAGGEHDLTSIDPEDASFPFSFGHRVDGTGFSFGTILSVTSAERWLYFSNPDVFVDGFPTGLPGERDFAQTIDLLAPIMANYRPLLFDDSFESGDLSGWSSSF
jgi:hypothetical protein